jgi:glutathione peroxidase-family protein
MKYLVILGVLFSHIAYAQKIEHRQIGSGEREIAPDFKLKDIYGRIVHLSDYHGKVVLMYFWNTNSRNASHTTQTMLALQKEFPGVMQCIAVAFDTAGVKTIKPRSEELGILFPSLIGNKDLLNKYRMNNQTGWLFLITKSGKVYSMFNEAEQQNKLRTWITVVANEE